LLSGMIDKHLKPAFGKSTLSEITPYAVDAFSRPCRAEASLTRWRQRSWTHCRAFCVQRWYKHIAVNPLEGLGSLPTSAGREQSPSSTHLNSTRWCRSYPSRTQQWSTSRCGLAFGFRNCLP
jgi:hypothetical protein